MQSTTNQNLGKQLGEAVKKLRSSKNISQMELQEHSGLSSGYISKLENGDFNSPTIRQIFYIAQAFEMSLRDLLEAAGLIPSESSFEGTLRAEGATDKQIEELKVAKKNNSSFK
ncbi:MAG: helix-turn-helix transcriptional regulator [Patescibacteria group bacterium]